MEPIRQMSNGDKLWFPGSTLNMSSAQNFDLLYEQHVDNASFLWVLRCHVINQPHYNQADITELDERIDSHLDALMLSIEQAWKYCLLSLEYEEPGEVFTAAVIAFRSQEVQKIQHAVEVGLKNDDTLKGLVSALGWLPSELAHPWIKKFLFSKDINHKYLGISVCSVCRESPENFGMNLGELLQREDCISNVKLYARCLRLIGECRLHEFMPALNQAMKSNEAAVCFWANWSALLLGNTAAVNNLRVFVMEEGPYQQKAIQLTFRVLPIDQGRIWIGSLLENSSQIRNVIKAVAVLGDPHAVNWLIQLMQQANLACLSGEAFTTITGIDLEQYQLSKEGLDSIRQSNDPDGDLDDEDIEIDEDENLLWPDASKVADIWQQCSKNFDVGERYFMGKVVERSIKQESLMEKFELLGQRQRYGVSLELFLSGEAKLLPSIEAKNN